MGRGGYASLAGAAPINSFGQDFLGGAAVGEKMRQVVGDIQINDRLKQIGDAVTQAGGSIDGIDPTLFSDPVGLRALGEYTTQYNSSQEGLQKAWKNHDQAIMRMFETTTYAPQAFKQSGDPSILDQASDKLGLPYQTQYNPETKRHEVMYAGRFGPEATGQSFTSEELSNLYGGLAKDPKRFSQLAFQYSLATMRQNEDYLKDPSKWLYDNDGKTVFVPRKMMTANGFRSGYIVTDTANKTSKFMTNEELQQAGVFPKDLQTMKGLFDMEKGRADMANDKVRLGYEGQRVSQGWATHNLNRERFEYEKGDGLIPGMPGINRKGFKKTMDADFNQWMAAAGYAVKNGAFYKPEYNKDGSIAVDDEGKPKLRAMSPAEVGEARAEHQQDFVKRYTGQSAPGQGGDVGNIILSRGLEYKGGKPSVPPAGNGGNIPSQGKTSTEQPARLGGGMFGNSVGPTDKPQRAEDAKLSGAMPGTAASSSTQEKERILPPKGSVWERMPDKYEAYTKVFGKRPDKVKPALAVKELDAELERLAEEKLREGMDRPNWWEADLRGLGSEGALKPAIEKAKQFIMDEILTSKGYYSSQS
ncbi:MULTISPECIES: hypothetical protein [Bilophila]|uniref:hypothetical protein n=1 Tax=Bilophila TaxID=35832 RepID=UPI002580865C|nr:MULTISPECIES: hypothetical protein [Bilophila]MBS5455630.1 hypothetical protein [Bilophila sp.]